MLPPVGVEPRAFDFNELIPYLLEVSRPLDPYIVCSVDPKQFSKSKNQWSFLKMTFTEFSEFDESRQSSKMIRLPEVLPIWQQIHYQWQKYEEHFHYNLWLDTYCHSPH